jgi:hypothetical protein
MKSVSFSLKKPEQKKPISSLTPVTPIATVIHAISSTGDVNPDKNPKSDEQNIEPLVIPCIQPIGESKLTAESQSPPAIPAQPGLFVPPKNQTTLDDRPSILVGLKRPEPENTAEEEISDVDAEDFAWGMLRGMGWEGDVESEISKHRKTTSRK